MRRNSLTSRPRAPVLVRATAIGTLALASAACGDDGSTTTTVNEADTDVAPTAGPCAHDPSSPGCASTGMTSMTDTGMTDTSATSVADGDTDVAPTAGPCAHEPDTPGCGSTTGDEPGSTSLLTEGSGGSGSSGTTTG